MEDSIHTATITFISINDVVTVPMVMQVSSQPQPHNAGYRYILPVKADTLEPIAQVDRGPVEGGYPFSVIDAAPGRCYSIAGTACGAYRSLSDLTAINVGGSVSGAKFATGFDGSFMSPAATGGQGLPVMRGSGR